MTYRRLTQLTVYALAIAVVCPTLAMAQLSPGASATDFAVFAGRDVTLESYSTVLGDVYAAEEININFGYGIQRPERNQGDFYSLGNISTIGGLSDVNGDMWANGSITFGSSGVDVIGNATYGASISGNAGTIVQGTINHAANSVPTLSLPPITQFSAGAEDYVEIDGQDAVVLPPGSYRDVSLTSKTDELHLSSGDYFMRRLDAWISAELHLDLTDGPINVYVANDVFFESGLRVFVNDEELSLTDKNPPLNVDLAELVTFETHGDFTIDKGFLSSFFGTVYAPYGNIEVDTQGFYGSMISGRNITGDFYIEHHPSSRLAVPEPSSGVMIAGLLAGLCCVRPWRRFAAIDK